MTEERRSLFCCPCGKIIQQRNLSLHCKSKHHVSFVQNSQSEINKSIPDLASYLRENDLRRDQARIQNIIQRYKNTDPYTKSTLGIESYTHIPKSVQVDHIHEVQILTCAIQRTPELTLDERNIDKLAGLRQILNSAPNLVITDSSVNQSKGQAIKYFLGHYQTSNDLPLLAAFIQTSRGKERSIARFATNIIDVIKDTSSDMSDSIREIRMDNGHITGAFRYETIAEQFNTIIDRMKLDWKEGIKLRSGKIYQAYK